MMISADQGGDTLIMSRVGNFTGVGGRSLRLVTILEKYKVLGKNNNKPSKVVPCCLGS